jgi:hypothetical protein
MTTRTTRKPPPKAPAKPTLKAAASPAAKPDAKPARKTAVRRSTAANLAMLQKLTKTARLAKRKSDAAKKKRLAELLAFILRRKAQIVEAFYDVGEALREVSKDKLYEADALPSFEAFLKKHDIMGRTQAFKLIKVVEGMPRTRALKLGQERAFALVAYTDATPERDSAESIVASKKLIAGKAVNDVSTQDIVTATKKLKQAKHPALSPAQRKQHKRMEKLTDALRKALDKLGLHRLHLEQHADSVLVRFSQSQLETIARRGK